MFQRTEDATQKTPPKRGFPGDATVETGLEGG